MSAKKGTGSRGQSPKSGEKTGRSIRRPGRKCVRLSQEPEPVSSLKAKRTGASPSCPRLSHNPCLRAFSLGLRAIRGGSGRFPSGASRAPFIQREFTMPQFRSLVKEFQKNPAIDQRLRDITARDRPAAQPQEPIWNSVALSVCRRAGCGKSRLRLMCEERDQGNQPSFNAAAPFLDSTIAALRSRPSGRTKRFKAGRTDTTGRQVPGWSSY